MKNSDLSNQFKQQDEKDSHTTIDLNEIKQSSKNSSENEEEDQIVPEITKLPKLDIPKVSGKFMNPYTGSSAVMTTCKHYSHRDCLNKYYNQQATNHE